MAFDCGVEFYELHQDDLTEPTVRKILRTRTTGHRLLHMLLTGLNPEQQEDNRRLAISVAETQLSNGAVRDFAVCRLFGLPLPLTADLDGALRLAGENRHTKVADLYRELSETAPSILMVEEAWAAISAELPASVEIDRLHRLLVEIGVFARLSVGLATKNNALIENIVFDLSRHSALAAVLGQQPVKLLAAFVKRLRQPVSTSGRQEPELEQEQRVAARWQDEILELIEFARKFSHHKARLLKNSSRKSGSNPIEIMENITSQKKLFLRMISNGRDENAARNLMQLSIFQIKNGDLSHLCKSFCDLSARSREAHLLDWSRDLALLAQAANPNDPAGFCDEAETLREMSRLDDALALYRTAAISFPKDPVSLNGQAETLREMGHLDDALALYRTTAISFPEDPFTVCGQAETLREMGRLDDALALYKAAAVSFPNNPVTFNGQAETLREMGRLDDALALYNAVVVSFPNNPVTVCGQAKTLREIGRFDDALALYQAAAVSFPNNPVTFNGQAETLRAMGRLDDALALYKTAAVSFPNNSVTVCGQAETLREMGRLNDALALYKGAAVSFPNDPVTVCGQAETLREMGRLDDALALYKGAAVSFPNNPVTFNGQAETLREMGHLNDALSIYQLSMTRFHANSVARAGHASVLLELGRYEEVRESLGERSPVTRQDWIFAHIFAMTFLKENKLDEAIERLKTGMNNCPFQRQARCFKNTLSYCEIRLSRFDSVINRLNSDNASLTPVRSSAEIILLSHARAALGQKAEAGRVLAALDNRPSAVIIDLRQALAQRYGIFNQTAIESENDRQRLDAKIAEGEFGLILRDAA